MIAPAVMAAVSVGSAAIGAIGQMGSAKQMKRAARAQANLILEQGQETLRRMDMQNEAMLGAATARGYASGLKMEKSGSTQRYIWHMEQELQRQRDWTERSFTMQADAVYKAAKAGASTANIGAIAGFGQTAANVGMSYWGMTR